MCLHSQERLCNNKIKCCSKKWEELKMNKYEELMNKSDKCCLKAIKLSKAGNYLLARFYKNASEGFKIKARKLSLEKL